MHRYALNHGCHGVARILNREASRARQWLFVLACLAAVIATNGEPAALAQNNQPVILTYYIDYGVPRTSVCIGETVSYTAQILASVLVPGYPEAGIAHVVGASLTAQSADPAILGLAPSDFAVDTLMFVDRPTSMTVKFTGKSAGRTAVVFSGGVQTRPTTFSTPAKFDVQADFPVRVIPCAVSVRLMTRWEIKLPPTSTLAILTIPDGRMTSDQEGYYSGEADMILVVQANIPECGFVTTVIRSKAKLRGRLTSDDELEVDVSFEGVSGAAVGAGTRCSRADSGGDIILHPIHALIRAGGEAKTVSHQLTNPRVNNIAQGTLYVFPIASQ